MKKRILILILVLLVASSTIIYISTSRTKREQTVDNSPVRTINIPRGSITRSINASGTISGARQVNLSFASAGQVQKVLVKKGDYVEAGTILAEMDSSQQELALLRANNALELAKLDGTAFARKERELDLKIAQANLEKTKIIAPYSGIIVDLEIEEGTSVSANSGAITLLDNSEFFVHVTVDEIDMSLMRLGQKAEVTIDALGRKKFPGIVSDIGWIAQPSGGLVTVPVSVKITEMSEDIRVGYSARVEIETARVDDVLKLPLESVVSRNNQTTVTVLRDGILVPVQVKTGLTDGREVEIISGLDAEDQVVAFNYAAYGQPSAGSRNTGISLQRSILGGFGR